MTEDDAARERAAHEATVHGLRSQGWPRIDAEVEADNRMERRRAQVAQGGGDAQG